MQLVACTIHSELRVSLLMRIEDRNRASGVDGEGKTHGLNHSLGVRLTTYGPPQTLQGVGLSLAAVTIFSDVLGAIETSDQSPSAQMPTPNFNDIRQILAEAQHRWLRPGEICEILRNHQKFYLTTDPPYKPPGGSLFLFDRKTLRYFRKDGHCWRKKKDGKTVREAHEKLKAGSIDVLHCYYAHGEDDENFQRRSYWMLDEQLQHIVLVHYREVKEGARSALPRMLDAGCLLENSECVCPFTPLQANSPVPSLPASNASSMNKDDLNGPSPEIADVNSGVSGGTNNDLLPTSSPWPNILDANGEITHLYENETADTERMLFPCTEGYLRENPMLEGITNVDDHIGYCMSDTSFQIRDPQIVHSLNNMGESRSYSCLNMSNNHSLNQDVEDCLAPNGGHVNGLNADKLQGELKKLDSFGQWMHREIGDCTNESPVPLGWPDYWCPFNSESDKEASCLSCHMHMDADSVGPSLSQAQLFSIMDFSPDWAYSDTGSKVLIFGKFLEGLKQHPGNMRWCCMFGEEEVPVEILSFNALRCYAPIHASGGVTFYITGGNRLACSEIREFEYRERPCLSRVESAEVLRLQISFAKMLFDPLECKEARDYPLGSDKKCQLVDAYQPQIKRSDLEKVEEVPEENLKEELIQKLLKARLRVWLACRVHDDGKGPNLLDKEGRGVIHLAASLGYEWALRPIIAAGVNPSFRDSCGKTALHWAAYYGREDTVVDLVRLGASPGAVTDPTSKCPGGRTAADVASIRGHKGIAGYLAETDLTTHLSSLKVEETDMDSVSGSHSGVPEADNGEKCISKIRSDSFSLRTSLSAVRKSAQAAAHIQAVFRLHSFKQRKHSRLVDNANWEISDEVIAFAFLKHRARLGHFSESLHAAALKIQQKYRGWKLRKQFLDIRRKIVKIQAHVRGCRVRKHYRKVVWSVSIVEKAILRWRRKGTGLRGFKVEKVIMLEGEKADDYDFLREGRRLKLAGVEKALARVQSMARSHEARAQYVRLLQKSKLN